MTEQLPAAPRTSARQTRWDCLAIVLAAALPLVLLRPLQDVPFGDDWTYAWSVQRLLAGHGLQWLDWSIHYNAVHVLWGALFCLPGGFSFTALRASTWTLAASGLVALYLLLRQLQVERRDALVGTATLGVNPIFFGLSFTFMTDVPFVALSTWAYLATIVALTRRSESW
ncbi:MAG TPA: glycosyltransferase family 39 protein, partial [Gemmatimonadaceae bacterium]|nr:glycosyltransferase family 39 protein [Gemmatimonadaceae bacterium]